MTTKARPKRLPPTTRRVKQALEKTRPFRGRVPSIEQEIGRLPRKKHSEAKRLAAKIEMEARIVWNQLQKLGGVMSYDDRTPAEKIQAQFGLSKKAFKRGLGRLYRQRRAELLPRGVRALSPPKKPGENEEKRCRKPVLPS
ncbi:MAG: hypothetical protein V1784_09895 [bacterium]